jgi:broad specificity phosphatase PhoE
MTYKFFLGKAAFPPMRILEHRRHSRRDPASPHLSSAGIALARRVGATLDRFDRVGTSPKPRAIETAIEMGLRVDAEIPELGTMPEDAGFPGDPSRLSSFAEYLSLFRQSGAMAHYARAQEEIWVRELERLPEGGRLLLISHGGMIESGSVAALGDLTATWGEALGPLEGVRLLREGGRWIDGKAVRVVSATSA